MQKNYFYKHILKKLFLNITLKVIFIYIFPLKKFNIKC